MNTEKSGFVLQQSLVDLIDLTLQAKQAHWNLTGRLFRPLHLQLDEIVDIARGHADTVAERAVAIGFYPDGLAGTVAASSNPQVPTGSVVDSQAVSLLVELLTGITMRLRHGITDTDEDPVTQDILIQASHDLEKELWMLRAQKN